MSLAKDAMSFLNGITRYNPSKTTPIGNPGVHFPVPCRNRAIIERRRKSDNKLLQRVVSEENVMTTGGLDKLVNLLATSALAFTATNGFIQVGAIGTASTAPVSTNTALGGSTASVHISAASMAVSDKGARSLEFQMTFDDANPYTVKEVGLFASSNAANGCAAHSTLAASDQVIKGTGDTVNVSHQLIFTTAS